MNPSVPWLSAFVRVQGEVLQMRPTEDGGGAFEYYVRKNYYKTGSLMANSCKASAVLGQHDLEVRRDFFFFRHTDLPSFSSFSLAFIERVP